MGNVGIGGFQRLGTLLNIQLFFVAGLVAFGLSQSKVQADFFSDAYTIALLHPEISGQSESIQPAIKNAQFIFVNGVMGEWCEREAPCLNDDNSTVKSKFGVTEKTLRTEFDVKQISLLFPRTLTSPIENADILYRRALSTFRNNQNTPLIFVGHSKGGLETLLMVLKYPELITAGIIKQIVIVQAPLKGTELTNLGKLIPRWLSQSFSNFRTHLSPGTPEATIRDLVDNLPLDVREEISKHIFYIRSAIAPQNQVIELKPMAYWLQKRVGANDGIIPLESQSLSEMIGSDLGETLNVAHPDLFYSVANQGAIPRAFMRALVPTLSQVESNLQSSKSSWGHMSGLSVQSEMTLLQKATIARATLLERPTEPNFHTYFEALLDYSAAHELETVESTVHALGSRVPPSTESAFRLLLAAYHKYIDAAQNDKTAAYIRFAEALKKFQKREQSRSARFVEWLKNLGPWGRPQDTVLKAIESMPSLTSLTSKIEACEDLFSTL